jgi:hypothetical protein
MAIRALPRLPDLEAAARRVEIADEQQNAARRTLDTEQ